MNLNFANLPIGLWLAHTVAAVLMAAGFLVYDMRIWRHAFLRTTGPRRLNRALLVLVPLVTSDILLYGSYLGYMESLFFASVALYLITVPLFDERTRLDEYAVRILSLLVIWGLRFNTAFHSPRTWVSLGVVLVTLVPIRMYVDRIRYNPHWLILVGTVLGIAFWPLAPATSFGVRVDPLAAAQGFGMFFAMMVFTAYYWNATHKHFIRTQQVELLSSADVTRAHGAYQQDPADIAQLFLQSQMNEMSLYVGTIDVDDFRRFNQQYGHMAGNLVILSVAERLQDTLDATGVHYRMYRVGGEEFTVAVMDETRDKVEKVFRSAIQSIHSAPFRIGDVVAHLSVSAGVAGIRETDKSIDDIYKRADDNLTLSKQHGSGAVSVDGHTDAATADGWTSRLAYFAQPIMQVTGGQTARWGSELLLRTYDHVVDRWVLPQSFEIPVTQQINLMKSAMADLPGTRLTINLTLEQFSDTSVATELAEFSLSPGGPKQLVVEIIDVPDLGTMRRISAIYRAAGIQIYVDDVGSDNSFEIVRKLLAYVDGVKFAIQNMRKTESMPRIIERINFWAQIAQKEGVNFILEGVEDESDVAVGLEQGIVDFQGYYYGKPELPGIKEAS